ncbi:glycosyltransferase family 4 protein [Acidobacteriota bacterium]
MDRPKIYHIITLLELGGAQQNTLYCTKTHDRTKYRVGLIAGRGGILDKEALVIPASKTYLVRSLRHPISPFWDLVALIRLTRVLRKESVDLVHTHSSKAGIVGRWAAFLARVPVRIHTIHGWSFNDYHPPLKRRLFMFLERATAKITHKFIAVAHGDVDRGLSNNIGTEDKYKVIHSGMNLIEFINTRRSDPKKKRVELGLDPLRPVVGMVACFKRQKAPLDFVEAAQRVAERLPDVQFLMVGDGILRDRIEKKIMDAGLMGCVKLAGWRRDVPEVINAMDVVVLTSLWEGLPRVIPQAFACGRPVVATAVDGSKEIVRDGENGFLASPGDVEMIAHRLIKLLTDNELRETLSQEAARSVDLDSDFNESVMVRRIEALYDELLKKQRKN